jgi:hypothetical protein
MNLQPWQIGLLILVVAAAIGYFVLEYIKRQSTAPASGATLPNQAKAPTTFITIQLETDTARGCKKASAVREIVEDKLEGAKSTLEFLIANPETPR